MLPPPDHGHVLAPEEGPVAGGAVGDALATELRLPGAAQGPVGGSGGQDHRPGLQDLPAGADALDVSGQVRLGDGGELRLHPQTGGVGGEILDKIKAGDAGDPGVVVHVRGVENLAPGEARLQQPEGQSRPDGVDGGGEPGGPRA